MKKEIPPAAIWAAVAFGIVVIAGVFFASGGTGKPTAQDQKEWEEQAAVAESRGRSYATGSSAPGGAPPTQPGQGSGEFAARQQTSK